MGNCSLDPLPRMRGRVGSAGARPPAILHVDTGMARLGLTPREFAAFVESSAADRLARGDQPSGLRRRARASAERGGNGTASPLSPRVFRAYRQASRPPPASFSERAHHFDLVRPGAALYGVNPLPGRPNPLRPVVRLAAKIIQTREIDSGESVGYGAAHVMAGARPDRDGRGRLCRRVAARAEPARLRVLSAASAFRCWAGCRWISAHSMSRR